MRPLSVIQCWDDGVTTDIRLTDLLRRYGAKATFNLNAGLHEPVRKVGWVHKDTEVWRLGLQELNSVYHGFPIANHTLTHPYLDRLPIEQARVEIGEGRRRLQDIFEQPIDGFVYPFGAFNAPVADAVREAGHLYARTTANTTSVLPLLDPMKLQPSCHFLAPDFWDVYAASQEAGVFYFWGHSYEMTTESMWRDFESKIARITSDPDGHWRDVAEVVTQSNGRRSHAAPQNH